MAKAKKEPSPAKPVQADVPVGDIDTGPADAVRATRDEEVIERYAAVVKDGTDLLPPPEVYQYQPDEGGSAYLLADGGYRVRAYRLAGKKKVKCLVRKCGDRAEAERMAAAHAAGANYQHGQARSRPDERAAVAAVIGRPEYEAASDRKLAELCRVSHPLVRRVREELSAEGKLAGNAAAAGRYKDSDSGYAKRMKGGSAATPETPAEPAPEPTPEASKPPTAPDYDDGTTGDGGPVGEKPDAWRDALVTERLDIDAATARTLRLSGVKTLGQLHDRLIAGERIGMGVADAARESMLDQLARIVPPEIDDVGESLLDAGLTVETPADDSQAAIGRATDQPAAGAEPAKPAVVADEKGRPVPERLLPVFAGRKWFRQFSQWVASAVNDVTTTHAEQPYGKAICLNPVKTDAANFSKGVAGAMPYVVCPSCDGEKVQGKTPCPTCSNPGEKEGRGWVSRMRYQQLTPELKRVCEGWGQPADAA